MTESGTIDDAEAAQTAGWVRGSLALATILVFLGPFVAQILVFQTPIDDAYISFRYADNWLRGEGLVFNPGERVEGYSNLLWVVVQAALGLVGVKPPSCGLLELFLAVFCLCLLWRGSQNVVRQGRPGWWDLAAPLLLAVNSCFFFWIGKGMEVVFYTFLLLAFTVLVLGSRGRSALRWRDGVWIGILAGATALTRPEGLVAPGVVLAALVLTEHGRRRYYLLALVILVVAVAGQFAFRLLYYGPLWPNTYYAKRLPLDIALGGGLRYLRQFVVGVSEREAWFYANGWLNHLPIWIGCLAAAVFAARQWRRLWPVALAMAALVAVAVYVGGDWMPGFRFLLPAIPLGCLLLAAGLREMAGDAATTPRLRRLLAPALLLIVVLTQAVGLVCMVQSHEFQRWRHHIKNYGEMADWLHENAPKGSLVALSDIGIISYRNPDLRFIDVLGLTDPHIASLPGYHYLKTDVDYILRREPDYVLVMLFHWPNLKRTGPKTEFDRQFLLRVTEDNSYHRVQRVRGWREGLRGGRWVLFEVYARGPAVPSGEGTSFAPSRSGFASSG